MAKLSSCWASKWASYALIGHVGLPNELALRMTWWLSQKNSDSQIANTKLGTQISKLAGLAPNLAPKQQS